jgi:hypothetical protein
MKAKLAGTTGMPFEVIGVSRHAYEELTGKEATPFIQYYADKEGNFYEDIELDFDLNPPQPEAAISGWMCRTKSRKLIFSDKPPVGKSNVIWHYREGTDVRLLSELELFGNDIFPSLTWQDEPIEVEITIKPKKK